MKIEELKKRLETRKQDMERTKILYNQLAGQVALLEDLIIKEENPEKEDAK
jgi:Tfp pilus assembly protein PilN